MFASHRPHPALSPFVESIWFSAHAAPLLGREHILPTGSVDIVIPLLQDSVVRFDGAATAQAPVHYRGAIVSGAHDHFMVRGVPTASAVIGVHFRPGGAAPFFGGALPALRNRTVLLDQLWGPAIVQLRQRLQQARTLAQRFELVESALRERLHLALRVDAVVQRALQALTRDPSAARIDAVQRASGCSPQQFIRRFDQAVGITPKRFARVRRLNALLPTIARCSGPRDWALLAAEGGYFDQSHLIHEFKRLAGVTPSAYAPLRDDQPTHVPIRPAPSA
jgi:AraC-like DNA-binding protein